MCILNYSPSCTSSAPSFILYSVPSTIWQLLGWFSLQWCPVSIAVTQVLRSSWEKLRALLAGSQFIFFQVTMIYNAHVPYNLNVEPFIHIQASIWLTISRQSVPGDWGRSRRQTCCCLPLGKYLKFVSFLTLPTPLPHVSIQIRYD